MPRSFLPLTTNYPFPPPRRPSDDEDSNLGRKENAMNGFNFPGSNKLLDRMFRRAFFQPEAGGLRGSSRTCP